MTDVVWAMVATARAEPSINEVVIMMGNEVLVSLHDTRLGAIQSVRWG